ncbi:MAG: protein RarD [Bdellovibrionaceae bacterium]|nr:protein RarD [Pseudobdellovibrionaceae bacterium]|tara:strand:- start:6491 stop:7828 length:1338 start_codon:yes stop_codon:yes gene_type:complete
MRKTTSGILLALFTFSAWGLLPIYWKSLNQIASLTILYHRIVWSALFFLVAAILTRKMKPLKELFQSSSELPWVFLTAALIAGNWGAYIYAVNSENVLQASLGYYINPLLNVVLGILFLGEKLTKHQKIAFTSALTGVVILTVHAWEIPILAITLASTMGFYALIKKTRNVDTLTSMTAEGLILFLPSLYLLGNSPDTAQPLPSSIWILLIGAGFVTAIPLFTYAASAKRISLSTLGFMQYIGPTLNFFLAVSYYNEPFSHVQFVAFGFVWVGVATYLYGMYRGRSVSSSKIKDHAKSDEQSKEDSDDFFWISKVDAVVAASDSPNLRSDIDGVLLDDREINHVNWKSYAEEHGKRILFAETIDEFFEILSGVARTTPLYIDRNLKDGTRVIIGDELARPIYDTLGFRDITLTTGDEHQQTKPYWIKSIIGKMPPVDEWKQGARC